MENPELPNTSTAHERERKSWFHSLTRRKNSQTFHQQSTDENTNNNNESSVVIPPAAAPGAGGRKRKDEKSFFQRFRKKMGFRFARHHRMGHDEDSSGTTNANSEFLIPSTREAQLSFNFQQGKENGNRTRGLEECEDLQFTHDYKRFIVKKWLEGEGEGEHEPNRIMYKACMEMLR